MLEAGEAVPPPVSKDSVVGTVVAVVVVASPLLLRLKAPETRCCDKNL